MCPAHVPSPLRAESRFPAPVRSGHRGEGSLPDPLRTGQKTCIQTRLVLGVAKTNESRTGRISKTP